VQGRQLKKGEKAQKSKARKRSRGERFFLSTAGLSIDVAAGAVRGQHIFPIKIATVEGDGQNGRVLWSGEASQVILGNAYRDAQVAEITADACADEGKLDLCLIAAGGPPTTDQETGPLTFRSRLDSSTVEHYQGTHFLITVPASTHLQLDGSVVQIEDCLSQPDREVFQQVPDRSQVLVTYRFDALPHAFRIAVPQAYGNTSLESPDFRQEMHSGDELQVEKVGPDTHNQWHEEGQREPVPLVNEILVHGKKVTLVGMVVKPGKRPTYILGGYTVKSRTGETRPIAVRVEQDTLVLLDTGEHISSADLLKLQEGASVIAAGKKRKHGVIKARHVVVKSRPCAGANVT
jgi:hypothetical protein